MFRGLGHFPSFGGYLSGHSFWRTVAYGTAGSMSRAFGAMTGIRARNARFERQLSLKMSLMRHGILPYPGETKATQEPRRKLALAAVRASVPAATVPPETTWRPTPKQQVDPNRPKDVIPARSVCAPVKQSYPAAVSKTGGLRGSSATRWRR